jgi:putative membrane protein
MGWHWNNGFMYGYGGGLMWIFWILLIVLAVVGIAAIVKPGERWGSAPREHSALDILKERYARGEIDRDEYEQKRRDLGG